MRAFSVLLFLVIYQLLSAQSEVWIPIDPQTVNNNPEVFNALSFGARYVINQGIEAGELRNVNYDLTGIYRISKQINNGTNYDFEVEISGDDGTIFRTKYLVKIPNQGSLREVILWLYHIEDAEENIVNEHEFLLEEVYISEEDRQAVVNEWKEIDSSEVPEDLDMKNALNFGIEQITKQAIQEKTLPNGTYRLEKINRVERQVMLGLYYKFDVKLRAEDGKSTEIVFVVYSQPFIGVQTIISYLVISVT